MRPFTRLPLCLALFTFILSGCIQNRCSLPEFEGVCQDKPSDMTMSDASIPDMAMPDMATSPPIFSKAKCIDIQAAIRAVALINTTDSLYEIHSIASDNANTMTYNITTYDKSLKQQNTQNNTTLSANSYINNTSNHIATSRLGVSHIRRCTGTGCKTSYEIFNTYRVGYFQNILNIAPESFSTNEEGELYAATVENGTNRAIYATTAGPYSIGTPNLLLNTPTNDPRYLTVGRFNNDNLSDIIYWDSKGNNPTLLIQDATGQLNQSSTLIPSTIAAKCTSEASCKFTITAGDIDGNGLSDIINATEGTIRIHYNTNGIISTNENIIDTIKYNNITSISVSSSRDNSKRNRDIIFSETVNSSSKICIMSSS